MYLYFFSGHTLVEINIHKLNEIDKNNNCLDDRSVCAYTLLTLHMCCCQMCGRTLALRSYVEKMRFFFFFFVANESVNERK